MRALSNMTEYELRALRYFLEVLQEQYADFRDEMDRPFVSLWGLIAYVAYLTDPNPRRAIPFPPIKNVGAIEERLKVIEEEVKLFRDRYPLDDMKW